MKPLVLLFLLGCCGGCSKAKPVQPVPVTTEVNHHSELIIGKQGEIPIRISDNSGLLCGSDENGHTYLGEGRNWNECASYLLGYLEGQEEIERMVRNPQPPQKEAPKLSGPTFSGPTIEHGFGTTPSIVNYNDQSQDPYKSISLTLNVGFGGTASSGVIRLPKSSYEWYCDATDITNPTITYVARVTQRSVELTNFDTQGHRTAWIPGDVLAVHCVSEPQP